MYPSSGLLTTAVSDLEADRAAAYRRAYNNWLHDFCLATEGRRYEVAVKELMELPSVSLESKKKIMWDNALKLYPIRP